MPLYIDVPGIKIMGKKFNASWDATPEQMVFEYVELFVFGLLICMCENNFNQNVIIIVPG